MHDTLAQPGVEFIEENGSEPRVRLKGAHEWEHIAAMTTMVSEVYDALKSAGVDDQKARDAAEALATHEDRFDRIEIAIEKTNGKLGTLTWMVGFLIFAVILPVLRDLIKDAGGLLGG